MTLSKSQFWAESVLDQAEIARLMRVTRARVTQVMNLLNLAPDNGARSSGPRSRLRSACGRAAQLWPRGMSFLHAQ